MVTYYDLAQLGLIRFTGPDSQNFLNSQLTCDVAALPATASTYGAYCTPRGRMLASFLLWRAGDAYFMQLPAPLREPIQKQLAKFILRSKVQAADASAERVLIGVRGAEAPALVKQRIGHVPEKSHEVSHSPDGTVLRLSGDRF